MKIQVEEYIRPVRRVPTKTGSTASTRRRRRKGYRIYLAKDGDSLIVLFGGGAKRRQQADIDRAKALHAEYKARKAPPPARENAKNRKR